MASIRGARRRRGRGGGGRAHRRRHAAPARRGGRAPRRPAALRVLSFSGGFTAGRGTTFDDIVRRAGAINEAAARGIDKFPRLSEEQVLAWNPDVLVAGALPGEEDPCGGGC